MMNNISIPTLGSPQFQQITLVPIMVPRPVIVQPTITNQRAIQSYTFTPVINFNPFMQQAILRKEIAASQLFFQQVNLLKQKMTANGCLPLGLFQRQVGINQPTELSHGSNSNLDTGHGIRQSSSQIMEIDQNIESNDFFSNENFNKVLEIITENSKKKLDFSLQQFDSNLNDQALDYIYVNFLLKINSQSSFKMTKGYSIIHEFFVNNRIDHAMTMLNYVKNAREISHIEGCDTLDAISLPYGALFLIVKKHINTLPSKDLQIKVSDEEARIAKKIISDFYPFLPIQEAKDTIILLFTATFNN